jgi:hypothetical protein
MLFLSVAFAMTIVLAASGCKDEKKDPKIKDSGPGLKKQTPKGGPGDGKTGEAGAGSE